MSKKEHQISVIIPAFNEEDQLPVLIPVLQGLEPKTALKEIIIVDGGSSDSTVSIAQKFGVTVITNEKGRSKQMNAGAKIASGEILYFLHADSFPPENAWPAILNAIKNSKTSGCFRLQFDTKNWFLKANAWFTRFDINAIRFGDQSLFVTKDAFEKVNGFDEHHIILEDQDIIRRLQKTFPFVILPYPVTTSDRKYRENGYIKLQAIFFLIYGLYRVGVSQQKLLNLYRRLIANGKV